MVLLSLLPKLEMGPGGAVLGRCFSAFWCFPVVPAIEKLLSSCWKEKFLGRSSVETKDVKGEGPCGWARGRHLNPLPFSRPAGQFLGFLTPSHMTCAPLAAAWP